MNTTFGTAHRAQDMMHEQKNDEKALSASLLPGDGLASPPTTEALPITDYEARLLDEIRREGSTRVSIGSIYREAIIFGADSVKWSRVNAAILNRYSFSGLDYIKKLAWGARKAR